MTQSELLMMLAFPHTLHSDITSNVVSSTGSIMTSTESQKSQSTSLCLLVE